MPIFLTFVLLLSSLLFAHGGGVSANPSFGFTEGFKHPIMGLDHLLAMLCVGMISARIGKNAIWQVPLCFVTVMAMGCVIGFYGTNLNWIELLISCSVIVFGVLFIFPNALSLKNTLLTVAVFAVVHGYAHGKEMPIFVLPEIYIMGFMVSTITIHVMGVVFGDKINQLPEAHSLCKIIGYSLIISGTIILIAQLPLFN
ncbi:MAG: HupE/UreJ family protein [Candidatus Margulisiibacteriota bacterium]